MNRLKLEYIFSNYLLVTMVILSIALGLCPVVLAIVFCILKGPINLLILLALFVSLPFSGCLLFFCADEYEDTLNNHGPDVQDVLDNGDKIKLCKELEHYIKG